MLVGVELVYFINSLQLTPTHLNSPFFQCLQWLHSSTTAVTLHEPTLGSSNHLRWQLQGQTSTTIFVWPTPSSDNYLQQQTPMTNSDNHLRATNSRLRLQTPAKITFENQLRRPPSHEKFQRPTLGFDNHLRLQIPTKIIFNNQPWQPPPNIIRPITVKVCCTFVNYINNSILSRLCATFIYRKL